jgi:hypothetical protein
MERSEIRGGLRGFDRRIPDFAALHPGYACCSLPPSDILCAETKTRRTSEAKGSKQYFSFNTTK